MNSIDGKGQMARQVEANAAEGKQLGHRGVNSWECCRRKKPKRGEVAHRSLLALVSRNRKEAVENCRCGHCRRLAAWLRGSWERDGKEN